MGEGSGYLISSPVDTLWACRICTRLWHWHLQLELGRHVDVHVQHGASRCWSVRRQQLRCVCQDQGLARVTGVTSQVVVACSHVAAYHHRQVASGAMRTPIWLVGAGLQACVYAPMLFSTT